MDVTYLSEFRPGEMLLQALDGDGASFGVAAGDALPFESTYCEPMVAGLLSSAVPDARSHPLTRELAVTADAGIGAYVGVEVRLSDGNLFGTLCALNHDPVLDLGPRHVELLDFLAGIVVERLEHEQQGAARRRVELEVSGADALIAALDARDHYTGSHSRTVVDLALAVAADLGLPEAQRHEVEQVALLHDIGKVGVPDSILHKRGPLNDMEEELMRQHPVLGARIVGSTSNLSHLAPAIRAEHERWDGAGYPDGLRGDQIPIASRIAFVCDAFHAMTSDRPYRKAMPIMDARAELAAQAGTQFDPAVAAALERVLAARDG
jgi:HD-GYP domain-containing protein (c-di-GMP phosphodiesterase class II)